MAWLWNVKTQRAVERFAFLDIADEVDEAGVGQLLHAAAA